MESSPSINCSLPLPPEMEKPKDPLISLINEVKTRSTFEALDTTVGDVAEVSAQDGLCKIKKNILLLSLKNSCLT